MRVEIVLGVALSAFFLCGTLIVMALHIMVIEEQNNFDRILIEELLLKIKPSPIGRDPIMKVNHNVSNDPIAFCITHSDRKLENVTGCDLP